MEITNKPLIGSEMSSKKDKLQVKPRLMVRLRPYLIIAPALLLTVGILYPFGLAIFYSLTNKTLQTTTSDFTGFLNYQLLFTDPDF